MLFAVCFFNTRTAAQAVDSISLPVYTSASFLYDFPQSFGATAGITLPLNSRHIYINKKGREKQKFRELLTRSEVGFYRYPFNYTALFFEQSIGFRYQSKKEYFYEWMLMAGVLRTFYDGTVYTVSDNGTVSTLKNFGRLYAVTGISTGFGLDLERSAKPLPLAVSLQPSLWIQYPYNSYVLPHISIRLSLQYHFPSFNIWVHQKTIKRGFQS
ncbi:MAG: hypothetical protein ABI359_12910 [Ginsengibacter sp.]